MCNNCQNTTCYQCNQPPLCAPNDCSCPVKDLSTDCVLYTGNDLTCSGIKSQTILTELIQQLDEFICTKVQEIAQTLVLINIGNGASVYKGVDLQGRKEIRKINAVGDLVTVTQNTNDISVSIDEGELSNFIQNELPPPICFASSDESVEINQLRNGCYDFSVIFRGIENIGGGAGFYKTFNPLTNNYQFKSLIVTSQSGDGTSILRDVQQNPNDVTVRLKKITSDTLNITVTDEVITLDIPSSFQGVDYYVNGNYPGAEELGTASKPFRTLKRCIDVILNRAYQNPITFAWVNSPNPAVNGGNAYEKWDERPGLNSGSVRVIIQSYTETNENLAINRVEYFLERGGYNSMIAVPSTGTGASLEYIVDMKELVDNVPKISGKLPYALECSITGKGALSFYDTHVNRKGFVRAYGHNDGTLIEQPDSMIFFGSIGGNINCIMHKNPLLTYIPLYSDAGNTIPIIRESVAMTGYQTTSVPDYGAIQIENSNSQFRDSLILSGVLEINCFEQHLFYAKNFGTAYGDNGRIYIRRNYQQVNYSTIDYIDINPFTPPGDTLKFYKPSTHVYDFYLKDGATLSYAGDIYSQENTGYSQGGSEAFLCLENTTTDGGKMCSFNANGGGRVVNLFYNHYIKSILNPAFLDYQHHSVGLKGLKLTSQLFEEVISLVDTTGADWTKIVTIGYFTDTIFQDFLYGGLIRLPFSNLIVNDKLFMVENTLSLYKGMISSQLPTYASNAAALADNYSVGGIYKDASGNLKIVI
jgi:hypothetical protein